MKDNYSACITTNTWQEQNIKDDSNKGNDLFSSLRSLDSSPPSIENFRTWPNKYLDNSVWTVRYLQKGSSHTNTGYYFL